MRIEITNIKRHDGLTATIDVVVQGNSDAASAVPVRLLAAAPILGVALDDGIAGSADETIDMAPVLLSALAYQSMQIEYLSNQIAEIRGRLLPEGGDAEPVRPDA